VEHATSPGKKTHSKFHLQGVGVGGGGLAPWCWKELEKSGRVENVKELWGNALESDQFDEEFDDEDDVSMD
jgi:hypothetical protein